MSTPGFYSLIQFCPDAVRAEGVNVGVLVGTAADGLVVRMAAQNEQVKKRFGKDSFDDGRLQVEKRGLARRLEEANPRSIDEVIQFSSLEAGRLVLLPPRPMTVSSPVADAEALFCKLVDDPEPVRRARIKGPKLEVYFDPLVASHLIEKSVTVTVPIVGKSLRSDYAYKNGRRNLIKACDFSLELESAFSNASDIGSKGLLLAKHPSGPLETRLIVISDIEDSVVRLAIRDLLFDHEVRLVDMRDISAFVEEVKREAHD